MLIFRVSPTVLGTVRKRPIISYEYFTKYYSNLIKHISNVRLHRSDVVLVDILSVKKQKEFVYVLERVFPSISIRDFINLNRRLYTSLSSKAEKERINRFLPAFLKIFKKSGLTRESFSNKLKIAHEEIKNHETFNMYVDRATNNFIILDYDKKTDRFKFGLIDFHGMESNSL
jgi:hypothetical protein